MGRIDYSIIGRKFGLLTVMDLDHVSEQGKTYWSCECECGKRIVVTRGNLTSGNAKTCGDRKHALHDLRGKRFGRLVVLDFDHINRNGHSCWLCRCDCGNEKVIERTHLMDGHITSCGCLKREMLTTHGSSKTPLYDSWIDMRHRCSNPNNRNYHRYGGRGISVCNEWMDEFEPFCDWAMNNGYKPGLTIERSDNDGDYCPENCTWVDRMEQANNRGTNRLIEYGGEKHTVAQWARKIGVNYGTLLCRIKRGDMHDFENYFGLENRDLV